MLLKKGQHVVCKYNGSNNGDLIVGRVESVRTNGDIILTNLLTGSRSTKKEAVLRRRNRIVSKKQATLVVACFKQSGDRAKARKVAVSLPLDDPPTQKRLSKVEIAVQHYKDLTEAEKASFIKKAILGYMFPERSTGRSADWKSED